MDLSDPQLEQQLLSAQSALKGAQADYKSLQATLNSTLMDKKTRPPRLTPTYTQDQLQAQTDAALTSWEWFPASWPARPKNKADN